MRTRNLGLPLLASCLLAALLVATPIAQTQHRAKRTGDSAGRVDRRGIAPTRCGARSRSEGSPVARGTWKSSAITTCRDDPPTSRSSSIRTAGRSPTSATTTTRSRS